MLGGVHADMTCVFISPQHSKCQVGTGICLPHKTNAGKLTSVKSTDSHLHIEIVNIIVHTLDTLTGTVDLVS